MFAVLRPNDPISNVGIPASDSEEEEPKEERGSSRKLPKQNHNVKISLSQRTNPPGTARVQTRSQGGGKAKTEPSPPSIPLTREPWYRALKLPRACLVSHGAGRKPGSDFINLESVVGVGVDPRPKPSSRVGSRVGPWIGGNVRNGPSGTSMLRYWRETRRVKRPRRNPSREVEFTPNDNKTIAVDKLDNRLFSLLGIGAERMNIALPKAKADWSLKTEKKAVRAAVTARLKG
ncbi:hypothetical protein V5O48_010044 [Marasmius crinis-equi]|uniref:Uncharacterized protein n=1 Tax=Marasmius crinis-equi TaxID=585013 RepID=A0ABR3F9H7_9AGAR